MASSYGLFVGINNYEHMPALFYATQDALALHALFSGEMGYQCEKLESPTTAEIRRGFSDLLIRAEPGDTFVLFFAGHGEINLAGEGVLYGRDAQRDGDNVIHPVRDWIYPLRDKGLSAVLIFDNCRRDQAVTQDPLPTRNARTARPRGAPLIGASLVRDPGVKPARRDDEPPRDAPAGPVVSGPGGGTCTELFSCNPNEFAHEISTLGRGLLSCALEDLARDGLAGAGLVLDANFLTRLSQRMNAIANDHRLTLEQNPKVAVSNPPPVLIPPRTRPASSDVVAEQKALAARRNNGNTIIRDQMRGEALGLEMVLVPSGSFWMGAVNGEENRAAQPSHLVHLQKPFAIGRFPVTQGQWNRYCTEMGWNPQQGADDLPAVLVEWDAARRYGEWLGQITGKKYRLPSEAEWEYAARSGAVTRYFWGDAVGRDHCWCRCGVTHPLERRPVGGSPGNAWGVCDALGNVWEWTLDAWHRDHDHAPNDGRAREAAGGQAGRDRCIRGGAWDSGPAMVTLSARKGLPATTRSLNIGFRLLRELD